MFDHYRPKPDLKCPVCGESGKGWQGKGGPNGLFVWEQGKAEAVDQRVDESSKLRPEARVEFRLPARFEIYTNCECPTPLTAVGFTEQGVWTRTELLSPSNAVASPYESESEFQQRVAALAEHPGHTG